MFTDNVVASGAIWTQFFLICRIIAGDGLSYYIKMGKVNYPKMLLKVQVEHFGRSAAILRKEGCEICVETSPI